MKKQLLIWFLICCPFYLTAQGADSVLAALPSSQPDSVRVKEINNIVWDIRYNEPDVAKELAFKALLIARKSKNNNALIDCYNTLGEVFFSGNDRDSALVYHNLALELRAKINDRSGMMKSYNNIGCVYQKKGSHQQANDYFFKGLKIATALNDSTAASAIYMNLAGSYASLRQHQTAVKYLDKALLLSTDEQSKVNCLLNLSNQYYELKNFAESERYFELALPVAEKIGSKFTIARLLSNISQTYNETNRFDKAEAAITRSLGLNLEMGNKNGLCLNYLALGNVLIKLDRPKEVILNATAGLELARELDLKPQQQAAYSQLAEAHARLGNYHAAYENMHSYSFLSDSVANADMAEKLNTLEVKYAQDRAQEALSLLREKERVTELQARNRFILLIFILVILTAGLFLAVGWFRRYRLRQQLERAEEIFHEKQLRARAVADAEDQERARIAKDIHDDLGSGLSKIRFLTGNLNAAVNPEHRPVLESISETSAHLVENMRELIWIADPENNALDSLVARIREYTSDYLHDFPIRLSFSIQPVPTETKINREAYRHLFSSVKECLQNIAKHAQATEVNVAIGIENELLFLHISDNGNGFDTATLSNGNGLRNITYRLNKIGGKVLFESSPGQGTTIRFSVSLSAISIPVTA